MTRAKLLITLVALTSATALGPSASDAQVVLRDDVEGWGWLGVVNDRDAIVQLAYAVPSTGETGELDRPVLEDLRGRGLRRVFGAGSFDATRSQLLVECTALNWTPEGSDQIHFGLHAEISYWDQTRLAETEIYESLGDLTIERVVFSEDSYVQACSEEVGPVLLRLGYDRG